MRHTRRAMEPEEREEALRKAAEHLVAQAVAAQKQARKMAA